MGQLVLLCLVSLVGTISFIALIAKARLEFPMLSNRGVWGVGRISLRSFFYTVANLRDFRRLLSRPVWAIFRLQIRRQCLCPLLAFVKALPRRIWTWTDLTWSLENGPFCPSVLCGAMSQPTSGNWPSLVCISIPFSRVVGTNHGCQLNVLPGSAFANTGAPDIICNNETQRPQKTQTSNKTPRPQMAGAFGS